MPDDLPFCIHCISDQIKDARQELLTASVALRPSELAELRDYYARLGLLPIDMIRGLPVVPDDNACEGGEARYA